MKSLDLQEAENALRGALERHEAAQNALSGACREGRSGRQLAHLQRDCRIAARRLDDARSRLQAVTAKRRA